MKHLYLLAILVLSSMWTHAAQYDYHSSYYNHLASKSSKYLLEKAYAYLADKNKRDSALVCYSIIANKYYDEKQNTEDRMRSISAMNDLGYMYYFYYFDYQKAYSYYKQAQELAEKEKDEAVKPLLFLNIANLYRTFDEMNMGSGFGARAFKYYKMSFEASRSIGNWTVGLVAFYGMAQHAYWNHQIDSMRQEIRIVKTAKIPASTHLIKVDRYLCDALEALLKNDSQTAIKKFSLMIRDNDAQDNPDRFNVMAYSKMIDLELKANQLEAALVALHKADSTALACKAKDLQVMVYQQYHQLYLKLGDKRMAADYQLLYFRTKDQLQNRGKLQSIGKMHFIDELNKSNEQVRKLYEQRRIQWLFLAISILILLIVIVFLIIIFHNYRKLQAAYERIYLQNVEKIKQDDEKQNNMDKAKAEKPAETWNQQQALIDAVFANNQEICSPNFSLNRLAELTGQKYWNMSHILKEIYGKNFNTLLNEYRIQEACRRLNNPESYGNYTIEGIALSIGFKSRSNFVTVFKNLVGMAPSSYQKIAKHTK